MGDVPASATGDLITLTIGGNDLLAEQDTYLREGLGAFAAEHLGLLSKLRSANPNAELLIVGNIYAPQTPLPDHLLRARRGQCDDCRQACRRLLRTQPTYVALFRGNERDYLCYEIEPSLKGAGVIAALFKEAVIKTGGV